MEGSDFYDFESFKTTTPPGFLSVLTSPCEYSKELMMRDEWDANLTVPGRHRENYGCEVVCFTADVGQGTIELEGLEKKAKASGASQLVFKDLKEEFARDYISPCLRAGAVYERKYLLGTSMACAVIAKAMVDVAKEVGADAVSHGCTGKGNDQVRFELTFFL
ncbi:argininosuccinate synthase, chloroplastic-like isoform X2 [Rhododendron vialii]|uniref:argininosuccinate synthase, chloroplastic-like isoform X2 n=1 Tax=Rhododendron vialii TaxID=182163 RepID=UPI00265F910B|nr:argininosuccinate synthase, chloroplastic-like isoform X2 [Rhododendron vialii]